MNMCHPRGGTFLIYSTHEENPCNLCEANSFHSFVIYTKSSGYLRGVNAEFKAAYPLYNRDEFVLKGVTDVVFTK